MCFVLLIKPNRWNFSQNRFINETRSETFHKFILLIKQNHETFHKFILLIKQNHETFHKIISIMKSQHWNLPKIASVLTFHFINKTKRCNFSHNGIINKTKKMQIDTKLFHQSNKTWNCSQNHFILWSVQPFCFINKMIFVFSSLDSGIILFSNWIFTLITLWQCLTTFLLVCWHDLCNGFYFLHLKSKNNADRWDEVFA
jgi:hypothetical protein